MKLQQNKAKNYFVYIPTAAVNELGLNKGDQVKIKLIKVTSKDGDSRDLQ